MSAMSQFCTVCFTQEKKKKEQRNVNRKQRNGGYTLDVSAGIGAPGTQEGTSL